MSQNGAIRTMNAFQPMTKRTKRTMMKTTKRTKKTKKTWTVSTVDMEAICLTPMHPVVTMMVATMTTRA